MPRNIRTLHSAFVGGEMSPEMFGRVEDVAFQHGAASLQNMIVRPQGTLEKRPGFEFVREVKDSTSRVRLFPFKFSRDQTYIIEMGRATVQSREIGYMRFHSDGGTLLYNETPTYVESKYVLSIDHGNWEVDVTGHGLNDGDPVKFTLVASSTVTVSSWTANGDDPGLITTSAAHGLQVGAAVLFRGTPLPSNIDAQTVYYCSARPGSTTFEIAAERGGPSLAFTGGAGSGALYGGMPQLQSADDDFLEIGKTYYARRATLTAPPTDHFTLHPSRADALEDTNKIGFTASKGSATTAGANSLRFHFGYEPGDLVAFSGADYYCMRDPTDRPLGVNPPDAIFWYQLPGATSAVTFGGGSLVNWAGHTFTGGEPVILSTDGTLPTGLTAGQVYYVYNPGDGNFQLADSPAGPVVSFTGAGTPPHSAIGNSFFEVPHWYTEDQIFELNYAQSNDVMTFVHPDQPPQELLRFGTTTWKMLWVTFNAAVSPPTGVNITEYFGEGLGISAVTRNLPTTTATLQSNQFTTDSEAKPALVSGDPVRLFDVTGITDGWYIAWDVDLTAPEDQTTFRLRYISPDEGDAVSVIGAAATSTSRVFIVLVDRAWEGVESYAVTALDASGLESTRSTIVTSDVDLSARAAKNTISWSAVEGASRYRIYKEQSGLMGFIGEVDATLQTQFEDDNIAPDLSITPPILDTSLYPGATVTFEPNQNAVTWTGNDLEDGQPITFFGGVTQDPTANPTLPTGITHGTTYYVLNPTGDTFQLSTSLTEPRTIHTFTGTGTGPLIARAGFWPGAVGYYEQRRVFAGSVQRPQDVWMTASGTESSTAYHLPSEETDRIQVRLSSREQGPVRHVVALNQLLLLASFAEFRVTPLNNDALTPSSISVRPQSYVGASVAAPVIINNNTLFAAERGGHLREMGYDDNARGYITGDLSLRAKHLFETYTLTQIAVTKAPTPVVWVVSSSGDLLGLTYMPEESIGAWHHHTTSGTFESCAAVPEGAEDRLYVVVQRKIDGANVRYVERMGEQDYDSVQESVFADAAFTYSGAATTTIRGLDALEGETVTVLGNGAAMSPTGAVTGGVITLPSAVTQATVGLTYTGQVETLPLTLQIEAFGRGRVKNINKVEVRTQDSGQYSIGPSLTNLRLSDSATASLLSGVERITLGPSWQDEGTLFVQQTDPLPLNIVAMTFEVVMGG